MATAPIRPPAGPAGGGASAAPVPVIRSWGLNGWYALAYVGIFALITVPVLLAAILNLVGLQGANWYVLAIVTAAIDMPILFYPWPAIGMSIAEVIRRLRDRSPTDTVTMPRVYRTIVISILATRLAIVVLAILPVARNGASIAIFLGLIGMVWLGNLIYSRSTWFVERVWNFYLLLLIGAIVYWIVVTIWPDLRHSAAKSAANETEQVILDQNEAWLKSEQKRIEGLLLKMSPNLSPAERVQRLSAEDRATWAKIQDASFTNKATGKIGSKLNDVGSAASGVIDRVKSMGGSSGTSTAAGALNQGADASAKPAAAAKTADGGQVNCQSTFTVDYTPSDIGGPVILSSWNACPGTYRVQGSGQRQQLFKSYAGEISQHPVDSCGRLTSGHPAEKARNWPNAEARQIPFQDEDYGGAVVWVGDKPNFVCDGKPIEVKSGEKVKLGLNVFPATGSYGHDQEHKIRAPGTIRITFTKI